MAVFSLIATIVVLIMRIHAPILWLVIAGLMVGLLTFVSIHLFETFFTIRFKFY